MEDFNSKYTGEQVESLLDMVANGEAGGGGGGIAVETDPIFSASPAATITNEKVTEWDDKQDAIADLETIRSGAEKGATAVQPSLLSKVATSGSYNDLTDKPETTGGVDIYVWNYSETGTVTEEELQRLKECDILRIPVMGIEVDAIRGYQPDFVVFATLIVDGTVSVAIGFDGMNYTASTLITDIPTEETIAEWGFTKNTGTYSKPSGGIPKNDLASAVQTSLSKADTALQSYTEQYKGTVTGVKINGTTKNPSSGVVDLGTVITDISGKQDKLVSGTNIKTINGNNILGSGNISIIGEDGATFTPSVDSAGNLSWSNNKGLTNPPTVNIKGPKGDKGDAGEGGGSSGSSEIETIFLESGVGEPTLVIDEMLAEKRYDIFLEEAGEDAHKEIIFLGFEGHNADTLAIKHFFAVITVGSVSALPVDVTLGFPGDYYIYYPNGKVPEISDEGIYELSITQVTEYGWSYYNVVVTPFS